MSMICYKGKVLTVDSNDTVAGYLVEDKGRIVYVGNELPEQYKNVQTVELGKKVLVPAFVDTHQHMGHAYRAPPHHYAQHTQNGYVNRR